MADGVEDVFVGFKSAIGEVFLFELASELFFGIEFGAVRRQRKQRDVGGDF